MSAPIHGAKREDRADMALLCGEFVQFQRRSMVACSTAAIEVKLRQGDTGFGNAGCCRPAMPCACFDKIDRDAPPLSEHEPVPVLRSRHGVGGLTKPCDGLSIVAFAADPSS